MTDPTSTSLGDLKEQLASIEHERWADWQKYMHSKFVEHSDGKGEFVCLPVDSFRHWERQIETNYEDLTEAEKDSDREQVDRYWHLIESYIAQQIDKARVEELERLDDIIYDDGRVDWGNPTKESVKQWGKNHADLILPTRYIHKHITDRISELQNKGDV